MLKNNGDVSMLEDVNHAKVEGPPSPRAKEDREPVSPLAPGVLANLKYDIPAGIVVSLIALPLCLGIALASGAPLVSGLIAGIVAGFFIAPLGGSALSVSGPAAGLTIIVLGAIQSLGDFRVFLLAVVLAGVIQVGLGLLKAGAIASYFPSAVIKGMLSAIGITLILKQAPHAVGYSAEAPFGLGAIVIGAVSLAVLIAWTRPALKRLTVVPAPLVVVVLGVLLGRLLPTLSPALALRDKQLVALPLISSASDVAKYITLPDFSAFSNPKVYVVAVTIAIIASLETLLCVEAADKLDPFKRSANTNRELKAQGVGNIVSGLLGGLPITAVIVRSAANVDAGARTPRASFVHSAILLVAVLLIPSILNLIPLAALAGILIFTGWRLASPALFKGMFKAGWNQFIPFAVTVSAILATDLLKGIGIGMAVGVFYVLRANYRLPYFFHKEGHPKGEKIRIVLSEHVSFLNKASILLTLRGLPANSVVEIDGTKSQVIDYDVLEIIHDFIEGAPARNIDVQAKGIQSIARTVGAH